MASSTDIGVLLQLSKLCRESVRLRPLMRSKPRTGTREKQNGHFSDGAWAKFILVFSIPWTVNVLQECVDP